MRLPYKERKNMAKILLDTDIGSDIDDSLCLAYLLAQPECDLLGITTVSGEPEKRAMLADVICKHAGRAVPIYPGIENPILGQQMQSRAQQAQRLANWPHQVDFPKRQALHFLQDSIRKNPSEITLLAIGPLTNVGLLFAMDEEIPSLLKELVIMGGRFYNRVPNAPMAEWNIYCDPYAAEIVLKSPVQKRWIGLDVTLQVKMDHEEMLQHFSADILKPVVDFAGVWFQNCREMFFHDPLAATVIFDEAICTYEQGEAEVELCNQRLAGFTYWQAGEGDCKIATSVDVERFFGHYFDTVANVGE